MMPTNDELQAWDREVVWHSFTQMAEYQPLIIERASGCTLFDIDGRAYLDGVSSLWCNLHGHRHPHLDAAIREQLDRVAHVTSLGQSNPTTIRLAKRLTELAPPGLDHVFFSSDGSSANEVALKMAFQYWQQCVEPRPRKSRFVAFGEAYHGDTLGSVSVGGVDRFNAVFQPLLFEVFRLPSPEIYRLPPDVTPEQACAYHLEKLHHLLEQKSGEIAAVIIEPLMQCAAGMVRQPAGYLRGVRELTHRYDVLLIADEVAVGFGKTGTMFACEQEEVVPDFLCLGKGITGGYLPLSATLTTDRVWDAFLGPYSSFRSFFHGHTFGGNPLAAAVALASLEVFDLERTLEHLPAKIARLQTHLHRIARHPQVGDVRQLGMLVGIELVADRREKLPYPAEQRRAQRVCDFALTRGVWLRPLGNVVVIQPPLAITLEEIDQICHAVEEGIGVACRIDAATEYCR
jgi:adenosylmethionine-8-amino-7-oxononanoate aminotransferase